jgi:hypothetical protein
MNYFKPVATFSFSTSASGTTCYGPPSCQYTGAASDTSGYCKSWGSHSPRGGDYEDMSSEMWHGAVLLKMEAGCSSETLVPIWPRNVTPQKTAIRILDTALFSDWFSIIRMARHVQKTRNGFRILIVNLLQSSNLEDGERNRKISIRVVLRTWIVRQGGRQKQLRIIAFS